ncbi:MAG: sugar transferase [Ignavibacteria bacterium]|nr:sugar transferase [Ignavibacteria bacterium]
MGKSIIKSKYSPQIIQLIADIFSITISYVVQFYIRFESGWFESTIQYRFIDFLAPLIALLIYWLFLFWLTGLYKNWYVRSPFDEVFTVLKSSIIGTLLIFFFVFLDSSKSPRLLFLLFFAVLSFSVCLGRFFARRVQIKLRAKGIVSVRAIIIGSYEKVLDLHNKILISKSWGYKTVAVVLFDEMQEENKAISELIKGDINQLEGVINELKPEELLISANQTDHKLLMSIITLCDEKGVIVKIIPDIYDLFTGQVKSLALYGIPLIEISPQLIAPWQNFFKRVFDIAFSLFVLIAGLPIWLLLGIIVKLDSKGPMLYKQERVGKNGKTFMIYKFRSMVQDAEKDGPQWAKVGDSRVTAFGKFLRKSHLDEIPQFFNILTGEMSIVGPRPERKVFVEKFTSLIPYYRRRLAVTPGLTGWWQINYTTYEETVEEIENRLKDDFYYIENFSLKLDLEIIIRTIFLVIKGHGQT